MNRIPDSTKRLMGNRRHSRKYLVLLVLLALVWFPGYSIYQYSFGIAGAGSASFLVDTKHSLGSWLKKTLGNVDESGIQQQIEHLIQENAILKEAIRLNGIQFVNETVFLNNNVLEFKVIGNDNFLDTPTLYLFGGNANGLRAGLPVLNENGTMIGTIKESQTKTSRVILTPSHESRIGAKVAGTEWNGILEGNRDLRAVLEMLPSESQLNSGDQIITDNRNPDIPDGILLGTVSSTKESDDHLFKEAILDLPFDSKKLDKVWVIIGRK